MILLHTSMTAGLLKEEHKELLNISPGAWMANDVQHMPIIRTYPHYLKADSVQVTWDDTLALRNKSLHIP